MSEEFGITRDDEDVSQQPDASTDGAGRQRSTIRFPYNDLADVEQLATLMHDRRGREADTATLAGDANATTTSGAFRNKINAGVVFGVFETIRGEGALRLTSLGVRLTDPDRQVEARAEAFLNVPLYRMVFDRFKGNRLPADSGLESEIERMGVAPKQAARARQAMVRSAECAGFYRSGRDRLVEPPRRNGATPNGAPVEGDGPTVEREDRGPGTATIKAMEHPLISGLLQVLPQPGEPLSVERRDAWLEAFKMNMQFIWPVEAKTSASAQPVVQSQSDAQD